MIYIDIHEKQPPKEWLEKAEKLTLELLGETDPVKRAKLIERNNIWTDPIIKSWLNSVSYGKCWYSETKDIYSQIDVDHFRPKKEAIGIDGKKREGYWWLAFDWENFRLCGTIGNRPKKDDKGVLRGKHNFFPLRGDSIIARTKSEIENEIPYLLDPTNPEDPGLLTFDENGFPISLALRGSWEYSRVSESVCRLWLDFPALVDERKKIWNKCNILINKAQNIMLEIEEIRDNKELKNRYGKDLKEIFGILKAMADKSAPLSSTARACLRSAGLKWAYNLTK